MTVGRRPAGNLVLLIAAIALLGGCTRDDPAPADETSPVADTDDTAGTAGIDLGTYATEPDSATDVTDAVAASLADGDGDVLLEPGDAAVLPVGGLDVDFEVESWERVGHIARVTATSDGVTYAVWLVQTDAGWKLSHTSELGGGS